MIEIKYIEINISKIIALLKISIDNSIEEAVLVLRLDSIGPTNRDDVISITESLDWSNAIPGKYYHLESGILTETPASPGTTYEFDYSANIWKDTRTSDEMWKEIKLKRTVLLKESDWTHMSDVNIPTKEAWTTYRQALRDITNQADPFNITWPIPPQ